MKTSEIIDGLIAPNKATLQWAATHLELTRPKDQFKFPLTDRPGFLPFPGVN